MKITIEWTKEELEKMIREKLQQAAFRPVADDPEAIQWKTKPALHVVIQAEQIEGTQPPIEEVSLSQEDATLVPVSAVPNDPAEELPDPLEEAARARLLSPNESYKDPRGDNEDDSLR